ncbi:MAG: aminotransferase [Bacteroidetes bacterium GWF2_42_66]|nr:MAG: aminotransferase [Bacteroidetes bacterium GWA2_42_15]OFY01515.1 MAG: aminotransferase [Bacteroidetes bacterium GWE2_42_39]OFY43304.1 MAG: aminotransferase [Bacteroidetes bacterium GWF2_42_66]HBL77513.1 aminotransferase [Prolixibacteraceae bacterium]HCR90740.1 aminotransferase [Prolixibacteraceae bacterium]
MKQTPIDRTIVDRLVKRLQIENIGNASIREIVALVNLVEKETGIRYCRMEMGVPGLPPAEVGTKAEIEALKSGVAARYPMMEGHPELKAETARFVKLFTDIDVSPEGCIPTVGSMQGTYAALFVSSNADKKKDTVLFIDPGFPVQKQQMMVMGRPYESFDVFDYRGEKLREKLESYLSKGNISCIIYSNPNNPSWICLTEEELQIIGEMSTKYDVTIMEDLAYFAMDFRKNLYTPGQPPFQPTIARYTDNYVLFISSSKIFSYAGQRIGMMVISDALFNRKYENLKTRFQSHAFGHTVVLRVLYALSSGTCHSAQFALAAMFKAANDGKFNFVEEVKEYGEKARIMKKLFTENGFKIVYEKDGDEPIANGFYFTIQYPGMTGEELLANILYYGISAISLKNTGSEREGLRACVSHVGRDQFGDLEKRLKMFSENFG